MGSRHAEKITKPNLKLEIHKHFIKFFLNKYCLRYHETWPAPR